MKFAKLNDWLALAANLGVLVGIIFLSAQISQSNRIATGTTEGEIRDRFIELQSLLIENTDLAQARLKLSSGDRELTPIEFLKISRYAQIIWVFFVSVENAYDNKLISEDTFDIYLGVMLGDASNGMAEFIWRVARTRDQIAPTRMSSALRELMESTSQ